MLATAADQYRIQQGVSTTTAAGAAALWRRMDGDDFDGSWSALRPQTVDLVERGRAAAVANAAGYTAAVLRETNQRDDAIGELNLSAFLSSAPDGRSVDTLLDGAVVTAKTAVANGATADAALAQGGRWLSMVTLTLLADTRREVYGADIVQRPSLTGYVRMMNPPSCARCIVLAGRWYRWNEGFRRHPRCDCQHVPGAENVVGDERTDPYATFRSMSRDEQERVFGRIEARAIRDGADIYRVVNVQQRGLATAAGALRYGAPSRLTVDDIYRRAGARSNAIRMMREEGYILDRGQVSAPLAPGVRTDAQVLSAGRGRGTVTIGGQTVTTNRAARFDAAAAGERDVLSRATMTAAERRLYDANYRLQYARVTGNVPRGVGLSSADVNAAPIPATPARIGKLERDLAREVRKLTEPGTPESVRRLARALGLL
jgi:hypothetical protein